MESQMALELLSASVGVFGLGRFEADLSYRDQGVVVIRHQASPFPGIFAATAGSLFDSLGVSRGDSVVPCGPAPGGAGGALWAGTGRALPLRDRNRRPADQAPDCDSAFAGSRPVGEIKGTSARRRRMMNRKTRGAKTLAAELDRTRWDYTPATDRSFLLGVRWSGFLRAWRGRSRRNTSPRRLRGAVRTAR